jgi:hypothetical protein
MLTCLLRCQRKLPIVQHVAAGPINGAIKICKPYMHRYIAINPILIALVVAAAARAA